MSKSPLSPTYYMFIDESGVANLNNLGQHFLLATVIIHRDDFKIIEGYLRLFKRNYFNDDYKPLHTTDICERPYMKYRKLIRPKNVYNAFFENFCEIVKNIPITPTIYYVDKNKVRNKYSYTPKKGSKPKRIDIEHAYEITAMRAINDYANFLRAKQATGEIVVESRLKSDAKFIKYFDMSRTFRVAGKPQNNDYKKVKDSIPSIFFSNKNAGNMGLELADFVAYFYYRKYQGDPDNRLKIPNLISMKVLSAIKKCTKLGASRVVIPKL